MKLGQKFAAALTVATLLYGGQVRMYTDARNRFLEHWEQLDGASIAAGILLLALALTAAREALARIPRLRRLTDHVFVLLFGGTVISCLLTYPDYKSELLYLALVALVTLSWCRPHLHVPLRSAQIAVIFSPIAAIIGYQLVSFSPWSSPPEKPTPPHPPRSDAHPIYLFIFDEWSYARSTEKGEFLPLFKNLRQLGEQSFVFHFAQTLGPRTDESVPRLISQTTDDLIIGRVQTRWQHGETRTLTTESPSLFRLARDRGYNTALIGFYLPQRQILGDQLDYCLSIIEHPKPENFVGKLTANALRNVQFWLDPVSRRIQRTLDDSLAPHSNRKTSEHWERMTRRLLHESSQVIETWPHNSFAVLHLPLPHGPWIFNADGSYAGPFRGERLSHDVTGYMRHLAFLDRVIGDFVGTLRRSGKFDESMIILTSDHSWRRDYTFDGRLVDSEELRRVPLFIKLPGQRVSQRIGAKFHHNELGPLIEAVMDGRVDQANEDLLKRTTK